VSTISLWFHTALELVSPESSVSKILPPVRASTIKVRPLAGSTHSISSSLGGRCEIHLQPKRVQLTYKLTTGGIRGTTGATGSESGVKTGVAVADRDDEAEEVAEERVRSARLTFFRGDPSISSASDCNNLRFRKPCFSRNDRTTAEMKAVKVCRFYMSCQLSRLRRR